MYKALQRIKLDAKVAAHKDVNTDIDKKKHLIVVLWLVDIRPDWDLKKKEIKNHHALRLI